MNIIDAASKLNAGGAPVCVAIGVFDGVHLGHQRVLQWTMAQAARSGGVSVVVTFDKHPNSIVAPDKAPALIYPLAKKLEVLASVGIQTTYVIPFDRAFSQISGERFVRDLARDFGKIRSVCVGADFMFGHRRSGNVSLLKDLGGKLKFSVEEVSDFDLDGKPVSSTRIREAVRAGDFDLAGRMLGRRYTLCGPVISGQQLGRKLGFPTANIEIAGMVVPPTGVYAAEAKVDGESHRAAVNIGHRPTVKSNDPQLHVEAHMLDFNRDIVGKPLELAFLKKIRDERKFESVEALKSQIAADVTQTRNA
ncbi:MAG TPA: bifunctional riboflavin kinase/FAD synthetase [Verrucomicrobiae bacterium]|jgi:riboflavin kinase/FMN adenylyltransferase